MGTTVYFPGFGIGPFEIDNVAFTIGEDFSVYWYGVIITLGILFAFIYTSFRAKYESIIVDDIVDIAIWTVILGVIGGRLYYVLTSLEMYIPRPFDLWEFIKNVFNVRGGGMAIYGAIIGGALGILIATRIKKMNTLKLMDMAAPGVIIAQALGRWGNFFNGEAFGGIISESNPLYFMRMGLISKNTVSDFATFDMVYVHPTFLYESLWNILGFVLLNIFYKKKKFNGQIACMYLAWYGFGRMFIEGLRTDSLYVGPFRISQVVGLLCFIIFTALTVLGLVYSKKLAAKENLGGLDKYLVVSLVEHPVFFEKKANNASAKEVIEESKDSEESGAESEPATTEEVSSDEAETADEAEEKNDGENN